MSQSNSNDTKASAASPPTSKATAVSGAGSSSIEQGTYELLRERLRGHGRELAERAEALNRRRLRIFGGTETAVIGNERIRTENNCIPRDIVAVGDRLLFGYNVFIGLKRETAVEDVLSLHRFVTRQTEGQAPKFGFPAVDPADPDNFLTDPSFRAEFHELYQYYKHTRLLQLRRVEGKLLAIFQIGATAADIKVFRWAVDNTGRATYIDNRGERDHSFPPTHDFEWTTTGRDQHSKGPHPHVNVLDTVFVETIGGDLTIKIEDNTATGLGIYTEPVDEADQSLDDAQVEYAKLGTLILLRVLPYRENSWRYLVFNTRTHVVTRIDAIGISAVQLPEDHGLIFPGGYYLQSGHTKVFDGDFSGMELMRTIRSPNGEDVLYVFHRRADGLSNLLSYNLIRKEVASPLSCDGYSLFDDGRVVVFRHVGEEPTRVHPMQVWRTPFMTPEHAAAAPSTGSPLENIGNADLVRGISDALSIRRATEEQQPTRQKYEDLIAATTRMADAYYWLGDGAGESDDGVDDDGVGDLRTPLQQVHVAAEQIIDEFEKVEALRARASEAVDAVAAEIDTLVRSLRPDGWHTVDAFTTALGQLRSKRGQLITLHEMRYVDRARLESLEATVVDQYDGLSRQAVRFLTADDALAPYQHKVADLERRIGTVDRVAAAAPVREEIEQLGDGLDVLTEIIGGLEIDDATVRTRILEGVSEVMASLNRVRALLANRRQQLLHDEGVAAFGVEFNLFNQSLTGALALAETPAKCDAQLSRAMLALEELESRFSEFDRFTEQLVTKREEVYEAFTARKQALNDQRQRRAQGLMQAAERILEGLSRRADALESRDDQNAFFASDPMVAKLRDLAKRLRELDDSVRADEIQSRIKSLQEDAARSLRDRQDIFEEGQSVIRLGRHRFSVNTQPLELTMVPKDGRMAFFLTGTDFFQPVVDPEFETTAPLWEQALVSETHEVYRAEYLAASLLEDAVLGRNGASLTGLQEAALGEGGLLPVVRARAADRYDEGYERGVHDHDAARLLASLLHLHTSADLLRFGPEPRAFAALFWASFDEPRLRPVWERHARNLSRLRSSFAGDRGDDTATAELTRELSHRIAAFLGELGLELAEDVSRVAGLYLFEELAREPQRFVLSADAATLRDRFGEHLQLTGTHHQFVDDLANLKTDPARRFRIARAWVDGFLNDPAAGTNDRADMTHALDETTVALLTEESLGRDVSNAIVTATVDGLLGQHPRIERGEMQLRLDEFLARLGRFQHERVPQYRRFQELRHRLLERERAELRLGEFKPRVLSSFVRNRLIDEVYLPLIGDNLAKQLGALGAGKRTDLMGMLLLISPPGYGKTTLMEYIANRLGLVFMKINGPALGHAVTSLDPAEAPNATARREIEKLNLALEMGNNVLLYLDDIQHTHPEFLQKFISLCDAQRKIEGIWQGRTRTYDLRSKRFAVCMAGNPYTESGERFQIPDMLANRADIYNLGDILEGKDELFALSYIENALTSNPVLKPLTTRDPQDVFRLVRMAQPSDGGEPLQADQLSHGYSQVELDEILGVLGKLLRVQEIVLRINRQYILSASQQDAYRTEPPFRLQGSYRNMNKMTEKVVPAMNDAELLALIGDHYVGEAQTLTSGAEENLLKLAELRGTLTDAQRARWSEIKRTFARVQSVGGDEADPVTRVTTQLSLVGEQLAGIGQAIGQAAAGQPDSAGLGQVLDRLDATLRALKPGDAKQAPTANEQFLFSQAALIDATLIPLLRSMAHKLKDSGLVKDRKLKALLPSLEYIDTLGDLLTALDRIDDQTIAAIAAEESGERGSDSSRPSSAKPAPRPKPQGNPSASTSERTSGDTSNDE